MLSLISLKDPSDRAVFLLRCANTLSYMHGLSESYNTEAWKYYIINLNLTQDHFTDTSTSEKSV